MSIFDQYREQKQDRYQQSESGLFLPSPDELAESMREDEDRKKRQRAKQQADAAQRIANQIMGSGGNREMTRLYDEYLSAGGPEDADTFMEALAWMVQRMESSGALTERVQAARAAAKPQQGASGQDSDPLSDLMGISMDEIVALSDGKPFFGDGGEDPLAGLILD